MAFITALIAMIIERFFDWSHIRRWHHFEAYLVWLTQRLRQVPASILLGIAVLPSALLMAWLNHALAGVLYGVARLVFGVVVLMYCLGPKNFWAEAYACIAAIQPNDLRPAMEQAQRGFGVTVTEHPLAFHRALVHALCSEANRRLFAVLFWFIALGVGGAVLYRLLDRCRVSHTVLARPAAIVFAAYDWLPVRVFTFIFALGGHFSKVIQHWRHDVFTPPKMNSLLLSECGVAAIDGVSEGPALAVAEKETIRLLDRVFVIAFVLLAVVVLL